MKIEVFEYNSFCSDTFLGNPAGVCMDVGLSKEEKQNIAYKNGFSETAFLLEEDSCFKISFFTPTSEIDLCGHATVASAAHLSNKMGIKKITFKANHDVLYCDVDNEFVSLILPSATDKIPPHFFLINSFFRNTLTSNPFLTKF